VSVYPRVGDCIVEGGTVTRRMGHPIKNECERNTDRAPLRADAGGRNLQALPLRLNVVGLALRRRAGKFRFSKIQLPGP
jgi:hypothetical protein